MQLLMDVILATIRHHAPAPAEGSAVRQLQRKPNFNEQKKNYKPMDYTCPRRKLHHGVQALTQPKQNHHP